MADNVEVTKTDSEKSIKVEFTLALEAKGGKVESRISFKAMEGVSIEAMQIIGRKVQYLKRSLDSVFASEGSVDADVKVADDDETPGSEDSPSNEEEQ